MPANISAQKRAANQLNAQRSTGPRSARGKGRSSLNALRHGLSFSVSADFVGRAYPQLLELLTMEGLDQQSALQVALKIIDYERNEYRAVQAFASERSTMTDINSLYARSVRALDLIPAEALKRTAEMSPEEREMAAVLRMYRTMSEAVIRRRKQQQAELAERTERTDNSDRYFRRASNQLIKALRACSYRPNDQ